MQLFSTAFAYLDAEFYGTSRTDVIAVTRP